MDCPHAIPARTGEFRRLCKARPDICPVCCQVCFRRAVCLTGCPGPDLMDCPHMITPELGSAYRQTKCDVRKTGCVACCLASRLFFPTPIKGAKEPAPGCAKAAGCPRAAQVREMRS